MPRSRSVSASGRQTNRLAEKGKNQVIKANEYEADAVRRAVKAVTTGISWLASGVDYDGNLPDDEEAAMQRLQQVLDALMHLYPVLTRAQLGASEEQLALFEEPTPQQRRLVPVMGRPDEWAEVDRLAGERGLRLEVAEDPDHPENPWIRLTDEPEDPPSATA
jgi:hypothetical protein